MTIFDVMNEEQQQINERIDAITARLRVLASHEFFNLRTLDSIEGQLTQMETELTDDTE